MTTTKIWECKIGEVDSVAGGADYPMRQAVAAAYREVTGSEPVFIFSGWGALLTEAERAVVENRLPAPATAPEHQAVIVNPIPVEYQYHYPDGAWRCSNGLEINGSKPTASRALYAERDKQ